MENQLNTILKNEKQSIEGLLSILEKQYEYIVKNDVFSLENIIEKLHQSSVEIAKYETDRRKLTSGEPMSKIVSNFSNGELENNYRDIKKLLHQVQVQKETNELLTKQSLIFANKMLAILNPDRKSKTYNAYGKLAKY